MKRTACRAFAAPVTSFLSDVEGDMEYFERFLSISRAVFRDPTTGSLALRDGTNFVFGGDAFDKGTGDHIFSRELVALKQQYPDRVALILGNRDVNKMKLSSELDAAHIATLNPDTIPIPFFMDHLPTAVSYKDFMGKEENKGLVHGPLSMLRWHLTCTMGCPTTLELRREELRAAGVANPTDEDILKSFLSSLQPNGAVREYLQHAQIGAIFGDTLFVHGGACDEAIGFVPDVERFEEKDNTLPLPGEELQEQGKAAEEWIDALNVFAKKGVQSWIDEPLWAPDGAGVLRRGGSSLMGYAHRRAILDRTVMVKSYTNNAGQWDYVGLRAVEYLNASGIMRVVSGHQPSGDSPMIINQPGMNAIIADNSYCDGKVGRGKAVAEVLIDHEQGTALVHGCRCDGTPFEFEPDNQLLGRRLSNGQWSKALLKDGTFLLQKTEGRKIDYETISAEELEQRIAQASMDSVGAGVAYYDETKPKFGDDRMEERLVSSTGKTKVTRSAL